MPEQKRLDITYRASRGRGNGGFDNSFSVTVPMSPAVERLTPEVIEDARERALELSISGTEVYDGVEHPTGRATYADVLQPKRRAISFSVGSRTVELWRKDGAPIPLVEPESTTLRQPEPAAQPRPSTLDDYWTSSDLLG